MYKIMAVTNRRLCQEDFLKRIQKLTDAGVDEILLREKDLSEEAYEKLAEQVLKICAHTKTTCILHNYAEVAEKLGAKAIHLPLHVAVEQKEELNGFARVGISVHSPEQLNEAEQLFRTLKQTECYVTAGHIFATDCKKGLPPRGLSFLEDICRHATVPVYAIGGITPENYKEAIRAGAAGVCLMSQSMCAPCEEIHQLCNRKKG